MSIAERLDRLALTPLHVAIIALCTLGLAADIGEVALSNTFSAIFLAPPYNASRGDVAWLLAAVFAGGAIGAPIFGWLGDRGGRRTALQLALAVLGAPAVIFLIRWLTPWAPLGIEGWRWALIAGAAVSALAASLFFLVPESPRWLAALGRTAEAERSYRYFEAATPRVISPFAQASTNAAPDLSKTGDSAIAETPSHFRRSLLLAALYGLGPWATIGFPLLSAAVILQKGFRVGDSLLFAGVSMLGPTLGVGALAILVDRIERRLTLILCAATMTALGLVFAVSTTLATLIALGIGFNLTSAAYSVVLSIYGAELFPTKLRALATSAGWGAGRVVSALVPIVLLPLLGTQGPLAMFGLIAAALLISIFLIFAAGPPGLAKKPVQ